MSEIVVGYDGLDCSKAALQTAIDLAKSLGDKVVITFGYAPGGYGGGEIPTQRDAVKEIAEKVTAEAADVASSAGVDHEVELLPLKPAHALNEVAQRRKARMIVVGSYGEAPLKGVVIGSTPYRLLHGAEVPVLVVPA